MNPLEKNSCDYLVDTHTHGKEFGPSTSLSDYKELVKKEKWNGRDALFVSDHGEIIPEPDWNRLQDWVHDIGLFPFSPILVLPGAEISTCVIKKSKGFSLEAKPTSTSKDYVLSIHVGVIASEYEQISKLTTYLSQFKKPVPLSEVLIAISDNNAVGIINHPKTPNKPNWETRKIAILYIKDQDQDQGSAIRALEVTSGNYADSNGEIAELAKTCELTTTGGSDAHVGKNGWEADIQRSATVIKVAPNEVLLPSDIVRLIGEDGTAEKNNRNRRVYPVSLTRIYKQSLWERFALRFIKL